MVKVVYGVDKGISDKFDLPKDKNVNFMYGGVGVNYIESCNPNSVFYGIYGIIGEEIKPVGVVSEDNALMVKESTMGFFPNYSGLSPIEYFLQISREGHPCFSQFEDLVFDKCSYAQAKDLYHKILNQGSN